MTYLNFVNITMLVLVVALQFRLWSDEGGLPQIRNLEASIAEQKEDNQELSGLNEKLRARTRNLQDSTEELEGLARSRQGLIREDETFFLIVYEDDKSLEKLEDQKPPKSSDDFDSNFSFPSLALTEAERAKETNAEVDEVGISPSS